VLLPLQTVRGNFARIHSALNELLSLSQRASGPESEARQLDLPAIQLAVGDAVAIFQRQAQGLLQVRKRIAVCATSTAPLQELTCHMGSHSVTCHPAEVTFPPLPQPFKAGTRFSDPRGMQG